MVQNEVSGTQRKTGCRLRPKRGEYSKEGVKNVICNSLVEKSAILIVNELHFYYFCKYIVSLINNNPR